MENKCSLCQQEAVYLCLCSDISLCKTCKPIHQKQKGRHRAVLINDPDLQKIRKKSGKKRSKKKSGSKIQRKKSSTNPQDLGLQNRKLEIKDIILQQKQKLVQFRQQTIKKLTALVSSHIDSVVKGYSKAKTRALNEIDPIEESLGRTVQNLQNNKQLDQSDPILMKAVNAQNLSKFQLISYKAKIKKTKIDVEKGFNFKLFISPLVANQRVFQYFQSHQHQILPQTRPFFQSILDETYTQTSLMKILKSKLGGMGGQQLSVVIPVFPNLSSIFLHDTGLGTEGAKSLSVGIANAKCLKKLLITKNGIEPQGIKAIARGIRNLTSLRDIDLSSNKIGLQGMKFLVVGMQNHTDLRSLKLANTKLGEECASLLGSIIEKMGMLKRLKLTDNHFHNENKNALYEKVSKECQIEFQFK